MTSLSTTDIDTNFLHSQSGPSLPTLPPRLRKKILPLHVQIDTSSLNPQIDVSTENNDYPLEDGEVQEEVDDGSKHWQARDLLDSVCLGYGYVPELLYGEKGAGPVGMDEWKAMVKNLGFKEPWSKEIAGMSWSTSLARFYHSLSSRNLPAPPLPPDQDDLNSENRTSLAHLVTFSMIHRPAQNLFVFSDSPRPPSVAWLLGLESPEAVLYVMRYRIANPGATILDIAKRLANRGIPYRTLMRKDNMSEHQATVEKPYTPSCLFRHGYKFTGEDFEVYRVQARQILRRPQGRAAILRGGIVGRIAINFLNIDDALVGPSAEVDPGSGFVCVSETPGISYMDDELTEHDVALICGANAIDEAKQDHKKTVYWYPPPKIWDNYSQCGTRWLEWSELNEDWFVARWRLCKMGQAQPYTVTEWKERCRGFISTRITNKRSKIRAQEFLDVHLPVKTKP